MLKAVIIETKDIVPPRLHSLVRLTQIAELKLSDEEVEFIDRLTDFYIKTRYPETIAMLKAIANRTLADKSLKETERIYKWLESLIK